MAIRPELIFILVTLAALAALFLAAWWRNRHAASTAVDPFGWLLEKLVLLAVFVLLGSLVLLLITGQAFP
ncbi:MAG: hypothetical protein PVH60_13015 [Anaerolineales bacterium]|jgi:high-affinity Fe2+/Pb2+ permease